MAYNHQRYKRAAACRAVSHRAAQAFTIYILSHLGDSAALLIVRGRDRRAARLRDAANKLFIHMSLGKDLRLALR